MRSAVRFPEFGEPPPRLTGERVTLRPWTEGDMRVLADAFAIDDIAASMRPPVPVGMRGARQWIDARRSMPARQRGASYAIVFDERDDAAVGSVELRARSRHADTMEVGYWLLPAGRGQGAAREAVKLACEWAFESTRTHAIVAIIDAGNDSSQKLVGALGFECRDRLESNDGWLGDWLLFERRRERGPS